MNFFRRNSRAEKKKEENFKAIFEKKLCLAKINPEPTFDISDCGLEYVPPTVFKFCGILRKTSLFLQKNNLKTLSNGGNIEDLKLLENLNISYNKLTALPYNINFLKFLMILDVSHNQITLLPDSICDLTNLKILNLSNNMLTKLPESIGKLTKLSRLDIENNVNLNILPASLHHIKDLEVINLSDDQDFYFPPLTVMKQGVTDTLEFLAKECDCDKRTSESPLSLNRNEDTLSLLLAQQNELQERLTSLELEKVEKLNQKLNLEQQLYEQKCLLLECQLDRKREKNQFLQEIIGQQSKLESEIKNVYLQKKIEQSELLLYLQEAEKSADSMIQELITMNNRYLSPERKKKLDQEDKKLQENLLNQHLEKFGEYRQQSIVEVLQNTLVTDNNFLQAINYKQTAQKELQKKTLASEKSFNKQLSAMLIDKNLNQKELIKSIEEDEKLQRDAVSALLEQSDVQSFKLTHEIHMIEKQLAQITQLELEKKKHNLHEKIVDLCKKRVTLSQMLENLLRYKEERKNELLNTLKLMENQHLNQTESKTDYWLHQYQNLLKLMPGNLLKAQQILDSRLVHYLLMADVIHCLPFVAHCVNTVLSLRDITDDDLKSAGVVLSKDRSQILNAINDFLAETVIPTGPVLKEETLDNLPSAPPVNECVVCFENEISTVFVDCGHCCCCYVCAVPLNSCPLCRTIINKKVKCS